MGVYHGARQLYTLGHEQRFMSRFLGGTAVVHSLPWDNNTWDAAAQLAARGRTAAAAVLTPGSDNAWLSPIGTADTPLPLKEKASQPAQLLVQTAIVPDREADTGRLIVAVAIPWFDIIDELSRDPNAAYQISPERWEEIVAGSYKNAGFDEVILTPRSSDFGRDVIAIKKGIGHIRVIDQVKAFRPDHLVTANDVKALMGVLQTDGASKGFLTTTSDFAPRIRTDPLIAPLIPKQLELINGERLIAGLKELVQRNPEGS
jgi:restriction system protein